MIIPAGFAQLNYRMTGTSVPNGAEIVIGVENTLGVSAALVAAAAADAWTDTNWDLSLPNTLTVVEVLAKLGPNDTGPFAVAAIGETGSAVAAGATPNVSYLFTKQTAMGGRTGRGRIYLPGVVESVVGPNGVIVPATVADLTVRIEAFAANLETNNLPMVLFRSESSPPRAPLPVTGLVCSALVATQRRRLRP